jgi:hypothetical protein
MFVGRRGVHHDCHFGLVCTLSERASDLPDPAEPKFLIIGEFSVGLATREPSPITGVLICLETQLATFAHLRHCPAQLSKSLPVGSGG